MVGFKKMFFPANEKAKELISAEDFGKPSLALLQYPQRIPQQDEFAGISMRNKMSNACAVSSIICAIPFRC